MQAAALQNHVSTFCYEMVAVDALDRLLETTGAENKIFSYTDRAEIARSDNTDTGAVRDFTWDTFSRLREVSQNGVVQARYGYDHSGKRMVQEHTLTGEVDRFLYEGSNILYEIDSSWAEEVRYTNGPGMDNQLAVQRGSVAQYYHKDGLKRPLQVRT